MQISTRIIMSRGKPLFLLFSLVILLVLQNSCALSNSPSINLTAKINEPMTQDVLFVGSVKKNEKLTKDVAICHSKRQLTSKEGLKAVGESILVAYVDVRDKKERRIYTPKQICEGNGCKSIDIFLSDHNIRFVTSHQDLKCSDPHGILKISGHSGQTEIEIANLVANHDLELTVNAHNTLDNGLMRLDFNFGKMHQNCEIPSGHQHVRYGRGWYAGPQSSSFLSSNNLYVCSDGIRVCVFSNSYMEDPSNVAVITGNGLNNTIIPSGLEFSDPARFCDNEYENSTLRVEEEWRYYDKPIPSPKSMINGPGEAVISGKVTKKAKSNTGSLQDTQIIKEIRHYKIDGWVEEWEATLRLFGGDGHDWIVGGPNNDSIYGGNGNDLLDGGRGDNFIFGEEGLDVMHGGQNGMCDGGPPSVDHDCMEGDPTRRWWPYSGTEAGDCCCDSCFINESCYFTDMTPGVTPVDIPPTPW